MSVSNNNQQINCPECDNGFDYDTSSLEVGDIIECPTCGATLEVISAEPVEVKSITTYK